MRLAAVTMVYNEAALLPVWLRHYARQLGPAGCHVIDHGSDDGSTDHLGGVSVVRLPRSPHDDVARAAFVSDYCGALLHRYDAVICSDVDELLIADPAVHADLTACASTMTGDVLTAIGINMLHLPEEEPALDPSRAVGPQRRWGWFSSALCKPALIRRAVTWSPGFHSTRAPVTFGDLFLFHLRYADRAMALARLARTRDMAWADLAAGAHQRVPDTDFAAMLDRLQAMDRMEPERLDRHSQPLAPWLDRVTASQAGRESAQYRAALDIDCYQLWSIPPQLRSVF